VHFAPGASGLEQLLVCPNSALLIEMLEIVKEVALLFVTVTGNGLLVVPNPSLLNCRRVGDTVTEASICDGIRRASKHVNRYAAAFPGRGVRLCLKLIWLSRFQGGVPI